MVVIISLCLRLGNAARSPPPQDQDRTTSTCHRYRNNGPQDCHKIVAVTIIWPAMQVRPPVRITTWDDSPPFSVLCWSSILQKDCKSITLTTNSVTTQRTSLLDDLRYLRGSICAREPPGSQLLPGTAYRDPAQDPSCLQQDSACPSVVRLGSRLKMEFSSDRTTRLMEKLTVVAAEDEVVDWLQTKESQEIPRQTGDPSDI